MIMNYLVKILVFILLNHSVAVAELHTIKIKSCENLFSPVWMVGTIPTSTAQKLYYIEAAGRFNTKSALDETAVAFKGGKRQAALENKISNFDFARLTPDNLAAIHSHIARLPFSLRKQLLLKLTKNGYLAEENFNTTRIANELMRQGLAQFLEENGGIQDRDIRDHYKVYLRKYFPLLNFLVGSLYSVVTVFELPALIANFNSFFNSRYNAVHFLALPLRVQEDIFLHGLEHMAPDTRNTLRVKSFLSMNYAIASKIIQTIGPLIALAFMLDQLSHHYLGFTLGQVFDDIVHREDLEEATYQILTSGFVSGRDFDEALVRRQIHEMGLGEISAQLKSR